MGVATKKECDVNEASLFTVASPPRTEAKDSANARPVMVEVLSLSLSLDGVVVKVSVFVTLAVVD